MWNPVLAKEMMTHPVKKLTLDAPVRDAAEFLLRNGISGAPVVDAHGAWKGVFTLNDIARHVQERLVKLPVVDPRGVRTLETREEIPDGFNFEGFEDTRVADLMTYGVYSVFPEATFEEVVRTLTTQKVHRVFIISEDVREILGVITTMDVLKWIHRQFQRDRKAHEATRA